MAPFDRVYTDEQRLAIERSSLDDHLRPLRVICERAGRGELLFEGERLEPFKLPLATARDIVRRARLRRAGKLDSQLALQPPQSQAELVRRRLMSIVDHELKAVETAIQGKHGKGKPNMQRASMAAKVAREALALKTGSVIDKPIADDGRIAQPPTMARDALRRLHPKDEDAAEGAVDAAAGAPALAPTGDALAPGSQEDDALCEPLAELAASIAA